MRLMALLNFAQHAQTIGTSQLAAIRRRHCRAKSIKMKAVHTPTHTRPTRLTLNAVEYGPHEFTKQKGIVDESTDGVNHHLRTHKTQSVKDARKWIINDTRNVR